MSAEECPWDLGSHCLSEVTVADWGVHREEGADPVGVFQLGRGDERALGEVCAPEGAMFVCQSGLLSPDHSPWVGRRAKHCSQQPSLPWLTTLPLCWLESLAVLLELGPSAWHEA